MNKEDFDQANVFGLGELNTGLAQFFSGQCFLSPLGKTTNETSFTNVTFEPSCRNNWHIHHAEQGGGQVLICTAGSGWYQAEGEEPIDLEPGSFVVIPANVKHWHGAKKDSWFSHIAVGIPGVNDSTEWLESVSDEEYNKL